MVRYRSVAAKYKGEAHKVQQTLVGFYSQPASNRTIALRTQMRLETALER